MVADYEHLRQYKEQDPISHDISSLEFMSMGMLIIGKSSCAITLDKTDLLDDVFQHGRAPLLNKLGGAGTYATMGARLFCPIDRSNTNGQPSKVGFIVHAGSDFPELVATELKAWNTSCSMIQTPARLTTRGRNVYSGEVRGD